MREMIPFFWYALGSASFFIGTVIVIWRHFTEGS